MFVGFIVPHMLKFPSVGSLNHTVCFGLAVYLAYPSCLDRHLYLSALADAIAVNVDGQSL